MTASQLVPALLVPLVLWRVYVRVRRNFGRQSFRPKRLVGAVIFLSVITTLIGLGALRAVSAVDALGALGGGLLLAVPLALLALRLTRFETSSDGKFYTPNTKIGLAVTLLFVGRITYRMVTLLGASRMDGMRPDLFQSPFTLFVFGVTAGYYITYNLGVFLRGRAQPNGTVS